MLQLLHLRTFDAVMKTGSFAAAGRLLGYSAPSVAQHIDQLEHELRLTLFDRDSKGVHATPAARVILLRLPSAFAVIDQIVEDAARLVAGKSGTTRFGCIPSLTPYVMPPVMRWLGTYLPDVEVVLHEAPLDVLLDMVSKQTLDVAVAYDYTIVPRRWEPDVFSAHLWSDDVFLMVPGDWDGPVESADEALAKLSDSPWISCLQGTTTCTMLHRVCAGAGFDPDVRYSSNYYETIHALIASKFGVSLVPGMNINRAYLDRGQVRAMPLPVTRRIQILRQREGTPLTLATFEACLASVPPP